MNDSGDRLLLPSSLVMQPPSLRLRLTILSALTLQLALSFIQGACGAQIPIHVQPASAPAHVSAVFPNLYEASIAELQAGLKQEHFTSIDLVTVSLALTRISLHRITNFVAIGLSREDRGSQPPRTSIASSH